MKRYVIAALAGTVLCAGMLSSCYKKREVAVTTPGGNTGGSAGKVKLEFKNVVGSSNLNLNNQWYVNAAGDSFKINLFNYYISNVKLKGSVTYTEQESYHLVRQVVPSSASFDLANVPSGTYDSVTFLLGVDSLRNVSGAQTGDLDPTLGMFWTWNTGYIMFKMEGTSPKSPQPNGILSYHAGGFSGFNSVLREITLAFPQAITVSGEVENHVHISANALQLVDGPNKVNFATSPIITTAGLPATRLADNMSTAFSVTYAGK